MCICIVKSQCINRCDSFTTIWSRLQNKIISIKFFTSLYFDKNKTFYDCRTLQFKTNALNYPTNEKEGNNIKKQKWKFQDKLRSIRSVCCSRKHTLPYSTHNDYYITRVHTCTSELNNKFSSHIVIIVVVVFKVICNII